MAASKAGPLDFLKEHKLNPQNLQGEFTKWISAQPPWVEVASAALFGSMQGAFLGSVMGSMTKMNVDQAAVSSPDSPIGMMKLGGPMQQAKSFAVLTGVQAGISTLMRRYRGVDDLQNSLVAAFGSGAAFSLVSAPPAMAGVPPTNPLQAAFTTGVVFALFQGALFKLGEAFTGPKTADNNYLRVNDMLTTLGLAKYEKNVRRGLLDDATILLWDSSALQEVKIPAGPRLLILHHIEQYRSLLKKGSNATY